MRAPQVGRQGIVPVPGDDQPPPTNQQRPSGADPRGPHNQTDTPLLASQEAQSAERALKSAAARTQTKFPSRACLSTFIHPTQSKHALSLPLAFVHARMNSNMKLLVILLGITSTVVNGEPPEAAPTSHLVLLPPCFSQPPGSPALLLNLPHFRLIVATRMHFLLSVALARLRSASGSPFIPRGSPDFKRDYLLRYLHAGKCGD